MTKPTSVPHYSSYMLRLGIVAIAMVLAVAGLSLRLWRLQVVEGVEWKQQANDFRLFAQQLPSQRGLIYAEQDGDPVLIAENRPAFDIMMVRGDNEAYTDTVADLAKLLGLSGDESTELIASLEDARPYDQVLVKRDVDRSTLLRVEELSYRLSGVFTSVRSMRRYPLGETGGQLLGYVGAITPRQLERADDRYNRTDLVGQAGLESVYDSTMRGRDGRMLVNRHRASNWVEPRTDEYGNLYFDLDRYGNPLEEETGLRVEPAHGEPVYTTLDVSLQAYCETLLHDVVGAITVLDADTGAVLALASSPGYDPSVFVQANRSAERAALFAKKPNPMRNRCYQEIYPPGSTFKVAMAAAALEENIVDESTTYYCPGYFRLGPGIRPWRCHQRGGHGDVDVKEALAYSCDVYFYNVSLKLGVDKIKEWSTLMGLGVKTGIDLTGEVTGIIPDPAWRESIMRNLVPDDPSEWRWYPGHTINMSIGQGDVTLSPLQTAVMTACAINGGRRVTPFLNYANQTPPTESFLSDRTARIVREGMRMCIEKDEGWPMGTGRRAKIEGLDLLGKTGTAEVMSGRNHEKYETEEDIPYNERDHGWFVVGVLNEKRNLAISVLIEHGLHGGSVASPYGKAVIEYYFRGVETDPIMLAQGQDD